MHGNFIWLFGGTTEGRQLAEQLHTHCNLLISVASEYGASILSLEGAKPFHHTSVYGTMIYSQRLDCQQMSKIMHMGVQCVIDATHPYAINVSQNIQLACQQACIPYFRLQREKTIIPREIKQTCVNDTQEAIGYLQNTEGHILLTTGSNTLVEYITALGERIYARILPDQEAMRKAFATSISPSQLIGMQGPFSFWQNVLHIQENNICYLVSKDSGAVGGMIEKVRAVNYCDIELVLIDRPQQDGDTLQTILNVLREQYGILMPEAPQSSSTKNIVEWKPRYHTSHHFPFFMNIEQKRALVVGAGSVGLRRAISLQQSGAFVKMIDPQKVPYLDNIDYIQDIFCEEHIENMDIVVAATNDAMVNQAIMQVAENHNVFFRNSCDDPKTSTFFFPAIFRKNGTVLGMITGNPSRTKKSMKAIRAILEE